MKQVTTSYIININNNNISTNDIRSLSCTQSLIITHKSTRGTHATANESRHRQQENIKWWFRKLNFLFGFKNSTQWRTNELNIRWKQEHITYILHITRTNISWKKSRIFLLLGSWSSAVWLDGMLRVRRICSTNDKVEGKKKEKIQFAKRVDDDRGEHELCRIHSLTRSFWLIYSWCVCLLSLE